MKVNAENVVIVRDHKFAPRILECMRELVIITCNTNSIIRMSEDSSMTANKLRKYKYGT